MKYTLLLDYVTFNFAPDSISMPTLAETICGETDLCFQQKGLSPDSIWTSYTGISYLKNSGFSVRPIRVQFGGAACSHFENTLYYLREKAENHISRCDFAFDVLMSKSEWRSYIETIFHEQIDQENKRLKRYTMTGSGLAQTIYIGSRKCAKFCRIYNKSLKDKSYNANIDGKLVSGDDENFIIRFELELKHFKSKVQDFDPGVYFDNYYHNQKQLFDDIKDIWRLYAKEFILPCPLDELDLVCRYDTNKNFVHSRAEIYSTIFDERFESPRVFNSTLEYVADRFGKYIPFIVNDPVLRDMCINKCEQFSGFKVELYTDISEPGYYDLDENDPLPFSDESYEQIDIL